MAKRMREQELEAKLAEMQRQMDALQKQLAAEQSGSGAIAQDGGLAAGERGAAIGTNQGLIATGNNPTQIQAEVVVVAEALLRHLAPGRRRVANLQPITERYLTYLVTRYRYLDFKGMGMTDRIALRLPLGEMYIPLRARIELPKGETWARALQIAGRRVSEEEVLAIGERLSEPIALIELLKHYKGLIILGDPGAGKTTFLKYLALRLALGQGETLGLTERLPILIPLSAYANGLSERDMSLQQFLGDYYHQQGIDLPVDELMTEALERGQALLLLDGLDEVQRLDQRHLVVDRVVNFFAYHSQQGNKFILTSRIVGYREVRPSAAELAECTLVDFDEDNIREFIEKWTQALERAAQDDTPVAMHEAEREQAELLHAIQHNSGVRQLAANPLLLTILALMKRQGMILPERRAELYDKYVETLLHHWTLARGLDRRAGRDLNVVEMQRVLAPLALWMHETSPGVGLVKREAVRRKLVELYTQREIPNPEDAARRLLVDARDFAGLLLERGPGVYGFIHLTFQEYLAAVALSHQGQQLVDPIVHQLAIHLDDDNWREVALLTIGYMGIVQQRDEAASAVLAKLIALSPGAPGNAVVLAGDVVIDVWPGGVTQTCKNRVIELLLATMRQTMRVKARTRARAGVRLGKLGDPRPEVMTVEGMHFCAVPAGPFEMGDGDARHTNPHLDYDFWMARYPVTNAQFQLFVEAGGYATAAYWPEAITEGFWQEGKFKGRFDREPRNRPYDLSEPFTLPNHPVAGVSWYESLAFTRWLTGHVRYWLPTGWRIVLPSEAEWEKAARGGEMVPTQPQPFALSTSNDNRCPFKPNPKPTRIYPWLDGRSISGRANCERSNIASTSAVGCFPAGASPYGIEDLAGNIWEWTRTLWGFDYPYALNDGRENLTAGDEVIRILRGGAYYNEGDEVGCGARYWYHPDYYRDFVIGFRVVASPLPLTSG